MTAAGSPRVDWVRGVVCTSTLLTGRTTAGARGIEGVDGAAGCDWTAAWGAGSGVAVLGAPAVGAACGARSAAGVPDLALAPAGKKKPQTSSTKRTAFPGRASLLAAQEPASDCPRSRCE